MLKICLAQMNPTVGDIYGNTQKVLNVVNKYGHECDIICFPEMMLLGYPPKDLLYEIEFLNLVESQLEKITDHIKNCVVILGIVRLENNNLYNSAAVIQNRKIIKFVDKFFLPTYDVFEEDRYFCSAKKIEPVEVNINGTKINLGIHICEDVWISSNKIDVLKILSEKNSDLYINLSASPFSLNRIDDRIKICQNKVKEFSKPFFYCNLVGGQDELVFDGQSFGLNSNGKLIHKSKAFQESFDIYDLSDNSISKLTKIPENEQLYNALTLGLKDYFFKTRHKKAVIGLSGGIDSALTCVIAAHTLGNESIYGYALPSKFSSKHSLVDAKRLAKNLNINFSVLPINEVHDKFLKSLSSEISISEESVALENLQSRIRSNLLMTLANKYNALLLTTSNKTEVALGYSTLYGDMSGAIGVISDLNKHQVYSLSNWINEKFKMEIIPINSILKEPSAELKFDQVDPFDYEKISPMVENIITRNKYLDHLIKQGYDINEIQDVLKKIRISEFKRWQSPPGIRVSNKAFGSGRRYPISNQFKG